MQRIKTWGQDQFLAICGRRDWKPKEHAQMHVILEWRSELWSFVEWSSGVKYDKILVVQDVKSNENV